MPSVAFVTCVIGGIMNRMQNRFMWNRFKTEERLIEQQGAGANAKWLWHGTIHTNPLIVCTGVDFRRVRSRQHFVSRASPCPFCFLVSLSFVWWPQTHRTRRVQAAPGILGHAIYFADSAAYVNGAFAFHVPSDESHSTRQVLLVRVLCGTAHEVGKTVSHETRCRVKPPAGFHSVSGGPHTAGDCAAATVLWAVYDRAQVYPEYIVTYRV